MQTLDLLVEAQDTHLSFPKSVPVMVDALQIGVATLRLAPDGIRAELTLIDGNEVTGLTPAIGYRVTKVGLDETGAEHVINGVIYMVVLSNAPNVDPAVRSVGEQIAQAY
ncbi:hypothetical protein [Fibrella aestuarina]|uniref:hypothetical protein n=1 Tax=Fibrella aestuarina TaxID=651143 RepID=UPI001E31EBB5|nr:hypothetical protein [Fibrella aestuarina]